MQRFYPGSGMGVHAVCDLVLLVLPVVETGSQLKEGDEGEATMQSGRGQA